MCGPTIKVPEQPDLKAQQEELERERGRASNARLAARRASRRKSSLLTNVGGRGGLTASSNGGTAQSIISQAPGRQTLG